MQVDNKEGLGASSLGSEDRATDERSPSSGSSPSGSVSHGAGASLSITAGEWEASQDEFGDWHVLATARFDGFEDDDAADQTVIVEGVQGWPENEANARLLAAAPDLFGAVEQLLFDVFEDANPDTVKLARAALSKAKGA